MKVFLLLSLFLGTIWAIPCTTKAKTTVAPGSTLPAGTGSTLAPGTGSTVASSTVDSGTTSRTPVPGSGEVDLELDDSSSSTIYEDCTPEPAGQQTTVASSTSTQPMTTVPKTTVTVPTTTLPQVNVSYVQFTFGNCTNGYCSYFYLAPKNDPGVIATDSNIVATDQSHYDYDLTLVQAYSSSLEAIVSNASEQVDQLQQKLNDAQTLLNEMNADLQATIQNVNNATNNLNLPNSYVSQVASGGTNDCFNRCTLPPTTPAPTTTPTPAPTTTQAFCDREGQAFCDAGHGSCKTDAGGNYCDGCKGNEDRYSQCLRSVCPSPQDGINATAGPFWSPGFNSETADNSTAMPSGQTCVWNYDQILNMDNTTYNFANLAASANDRNKPYAYLQPLDGNDYNIIPILSTQTVKKFNQIINLKKTQSAMSKFAIYVVTPANATADQYFFWKFLPA